jgi:hypothetical protein
MRVANSPKRGPMRLAFGKPRLEEARRDLVRASIAAGAWSWDSPPQSLRDVARELYARLVPNKVDH